MSCSSCTNSSNPDCAHQLVFKVDGQYLAPYIGGSPIEPIDLKPLVQESESETRLQLDMQTPSLVYTGEGAAKGGAPDVIPIESIAALMGISGLKDVQYSIANNGDLLIYDVETGNWIAYTIPDGTAVSTLGVDGDGKVIKSVAAAPLPGSVEVPVGGGIFWTAPEASLPSNFMRADGREINRTVYAAYFTLVGTTYGPGNNTTTFNIPNIKDRTIVGVDETHADFDALGKTAGVISNNLTHSHAVDAHDHVEGNLATSNQSNNHSHGGIVRGVAGSDGVTADHVHYYTRSAGSRAPGTNTQLGVTTNIQPSIAMFWAVRVI
jgi:microcystin-dependent protein